MKPFKYNPNNQSGQFRHRIVFQELAGNGSVDEDGFPIDDWKDAKSAWAMIKTLKGNEFYQAASTQNETSMRFVIHYMLGLHPDMKVLYDGRSFEIKSIINDDEANVTMTLIVNETIPKLTGGN